jgi:hypothetical protein
VGAALGVGSKRTVKQINLARLVKITHRHESCIDLILVEMFGLVRETDLLKVLQIE